jgi:hypothetical protein
MGPGARLCFLPLFCEGAVKRLDLALETALSARAVSFSWKGRDAAVARRRSERSGRPPALRHIPPAALPPNPVTSRAGRPIRMCRNVCGIPNGRALELSIAARKARPLWLFWRSWYGDARGAAVFSRARAGAAPTSGHAPTARPPRSVPTAPNACVPSAKAARAGLLFQDRADSLAADAEDTAEHRHRHPGRIGGV